MGAMAPRRSKLDTEIQRLYGLPFGEFTAARNTLAKELKKQGDKDAAEEVASLPKPTVSAWAVNHLFTTDSERMEELLASGERARKALRAILSGGDPGALRDAIQEARDLANELRDRAAEAITEETRKPGAAIVDRIATNLQSLAFSPAAEPVIERGWMDVDLPPPGFEVLAGLQLAGLPKRAARPPKPLPAKKPAAPPAPIKLDRQAEAKERREREAAAARERREKEAARVRELKEKEQARQRDKLDRAQAQREEAAGRADFLRRKAEQAERAAEELRQRLEEAERLAAEAGKRADDAEKALARAEKAVKTAKGR
jgi:DNA repair exonuclease SbcCD ATPase subunit